MSEGSLGKFARLCSTSIDRNRIMELFNISRMGRDFDRDFDESSSFMVGTPYNLALTMYNKGFQ